MAYKFDIEIVSKAIIRKIIRLAILLILYINSKFLLNCLIKLNTI